MDFTSIRYLDIIGDVHGCYDELLLLIKELGYIKKDRLYHHPQGRMLVFLGDLCDRGPHSLDVLEFVRAHKEAGLALHCPGNHDDKLLRWCQGRKVQLKHGLETTVEEIKKTKDPQATKQWIEQYLTKLPLYFIFDHGNLLVSHAGLPTEYKRLPYKKLKEICLYGFPTGKWDQHGLPERSPVKKHYAGKALLVHGHTPLHRPEWERNILNIDTGCVFGGKLTCFRYPEKEFKQVQALRKYGESKRFQI